MKSCSNLYRTLAVFCFLSLIGPAVAAQVKPVLQVSENRRYLEYQNGTPFFWLGGTTWGMPEWLTREEVDYYLDHRQDQGFNLLQCVFP